jgi:geranylgeranyl pyrophosphate synthase
MGTDLPNQGRYTRAVANHLAKLSRENSMPRIFVDALDGLFNAGGKLIRPILALCSSETTGRCFTQVVLDSAIAIEMVHVSSLILDDIIDESPRRRGIRSLHRQYGNDVAIVSAGMLLLKGLKAVGEVKIIRSIGYEALRQLILGQAIESRGGVRTQNQYLRMIELKTASLFKAATEMGAAANGLPRTTRNALGEYGKNLGLAFQLTDDLLDFCGCATTMRKPVRTDVRHGKPTIVSIRLRETLHITRADLARRNLARLHQLATSTGIIAQAGRLAETYAHRAIAAIAGLDDTPAKRCLVAYAENVTKRRC